MKLPVLKVLWLHDNPCAQVYKRLHRYKTTGK